MKKINMKKIIMLLPLLLASAAGAQVVQGANRPPTTQELIAAKIARDNQKRDLAEAATAQKEAERKNAAAQKALDAQAAALKKNSDAAKAKALKKNQAEAERGEPYGLERMGERYRDGDGVPEDAEKSKDYFRRAALARGDNTALTNSASTRKP